MLKDRSCGELRASDEGTTVTLAGWVHRRRDHGGLIFIDLRDRSGLVQVVFNPQEAADAHAVAEDCRGEYVVRVTGAVTRRREGTENADLPTGEIEVHATAAEVLNPAKTPPFYITEETEVEELLRLKYRYLDLRRPTHARTTSSCATASYQLIRDFLAERGFVEIETPILTAPTPEGRARLPRPQPRPPRPLLRPAPVAAAVQAAPDGRRLRALLPDRPLLPRRRPARRPPAGVHPARPRDVSFVEEEDIIELMEALYTQMVQTLGPT